MGPKKDSMGHLGTHSDWKGLILSGQAKVVSLLVSNGLILSGRQEADNMSRQSNFVCNCEMASIDTMEVDWDETDTPTTNFEKTMVSTPVQVQFPEIWGIR